MKKFLRILPIFIGFFAFSLSGYAQYCTTGLYTTGCTVGDDIDNVTIGSFVQTATGCSTGGYADYTGDTISLALATPHTIAITSNFSGQFHAIWVDWNNDGDFSDTLEFVWNTTVGSNNVLTSFILPLADTGVYRMRLRGQWNTAIGAGQSCSSMTYGEVHDYTVKVTPPPPCPQPFGFTFSPITSSSATISFSSPGNLFYVEYGPCGFTQGTGSLDTVTSTTFTLNNLASNSEYEVYVKSDCSASGNGISSWASGGCFKTECSAIPTPFTENFDFTAAGSFGNPVVPDCWKYVAPSNGGAGYGYVQSNANNSRSLPNCYYMYSSNNFTNSDLMGLVSPEVGGMGTVDKRIEFWGRNSSGGTSNSQVYVGTVSSPTQMGSFVPLDTFDIGNSTTYKYFVVDMTVANGYNGTHKYIAILDGSPDFTTTYIDDMKISDVPNCIPSINLTANSVTNTSANLTWIAGDGLTYEIEYGPVGFTQGTGPVITGITTTSYTLNGLAGNHCYEVYLRDSCAGGKSPWFGPIVFCTACDPVAAPIIEGFELGALGSNVNPTVPECWSYWKSPSSPGYGYIYNFGTPNTGTQHYRQYNAGSTVDTIALISPAIQGLTSSNKMVSFYVSTNSTFTTGGVYVGTSPTPDMRNATILDSFVADANYLKHTVYLDASSGYNGTDSYVFFMHGNKNMATGTPGTFISVYYDDISIEDIPQCTAPWNLNTTSITSSAATANWASLYGTSFRLEYGPQGFIAGTGGTGTVVSNTTSPTVMNGLTPNTYYDFYVSDNCDSTILSGPITFKTNCTGQLSGTYTVGGASSDFATLDSAFTVLSGCGISGPVTFNLQGGTHVASTKFTANGSSATNTITINGGGVGVDTIQFPAGQSVGLEFDGASYININNVTLDGSNSSRAIWFHNNANHITIEDCDVFVPVGTSSATNAIVASSSATSATANGNNANNITISNCNISGGYYGIILIGSSTTQRAMSNSIVDCTIRDSYYYGAYLSYQNNLVLTGNDILVNYQFSYAVYVYYNSNYTITDNLLFGGNYGLYIGQGNNLYGVTAKSSVANNFSAGSTYGMYFSTNRHANVYQNSIRGGQGLYMIGTCDTINLKNNILVGSSSNTLYYTGTPNQFTIDNNVYYNETGGAIARWGATTHATLAAWKTANATLNTNSLEGDPGFLSNTDFHIVGTLPNDAGDNTLGITTDIDGDSRPASGSTSVDIGADEFTPLTWDVSVQAAMLPIRGCGDSTTQVSLIVKNFGLNTVTSLPVTAVISGGVTTTITNTATVNLAQGQTDTVSVGSFNTYQGATGVNFTLYASLAGDLKSSNDTINLGPGEYLPAEPTVVAGVDTLCSSVDSVDINVISFPGLNYVWYDAATGGNIVDYGDTISVPTNGPSTYYVAYDSITGDKQIGAGIAVTTGTYITPYKTFYMDGRAQYLILASELIDMGIVGIGEIKSLAFEVSSADPYVMNDFTIKMGGTSATEMTSSFLPNTTMTTVYNNISESVTAAGWNTHTFTTPFMWNGADNIVVEVCFDNTGYGSNSSVKYTTTTFNSVVDGYRDESTASGCTPGIIINAAASNTRPNMMFNVKVAPCSMVRIPYNFILSADSAHADFTSVVMSNGADVNFDASTSLGQIFAWNYGDGNTGAGQMTSHTYAAAGEYTVCLTVTDTNCNSIDSICYKVLSTIGLDETLLNQSLNVYPNPNNGDFRIEFQVDGLKEVSIRVLTLMGQLVYESKPGNISGNYHEELNLSKQPAGVYLIQIISEDDIATKRVTIQK